jgi:aminopeptidase N
VRPYRERYFEVIAQVWAGRSAEMASMVASALYPGQFIEARTIELTEDFLARADLPAGLRRVVTEGRDGVERALRCQACDAAEVRE